MEFTRKQIGDTQEEKRMNQFEQQIDQYLEYDYGVTAREASVEQLYNACLLYTSPSPRDTR